MMLRLPLMAIAAAAGTFAFAQTAPPLGDSAKALLGTWEFSNADRDKTCAATFKPDATSVGYKVEFDNNCASLFPIVGDIAGWVFPENDLLRLLDAQKRTLIEFSEVEDGMYEAPTPGLGVLFLQNAAAAGPPARPPDEVAGDWAIARANGTLLCRLTLSAAPAGDALALTVKPGCDASIARLNFGAWRLDRGELMLVPARGSPWRFEEVDAASWRRLPDSAEQFVLLRQ